MPRSSDIALLEALEAAVGDGGGGDRGGGDDRDRGDGGRGSGGLCSRCRIYPVVPELECTLCVNFVIDDITDIWNSRNG